MFQFKGIVKQMIDLRRENARLRAALDKTNADVAYLAMMTDVELDGEFEENEEGGSDDE